MPQVQREGGAETGEREPIEMIHEYLRVLRGTDLEEYQAANRMLDDVMRHSTPSGGSYESATSMAIRDLETLNKSPQPENLSRLNSSRTFAAIHVVRGMLQGKKFPVDKFGEAITDVLHTLATIDGSGGVPVAKHSKLIRREVKDVLSFERGIHGDPAVVRRAAEVFGFVGRPLAYGRIMVLRAKLSAKETA